MLPVQPVCTASILRCVCGLLQASLHHQAIMPVYAILPQPICTNNGAGPVKCTLSAHVYCGRQVHVHVVYEHLTPGHMYTSPGHMYTSPLVTCTPHPWSHVHLTPGHIYTSPGHMYTSPGNRYTSSLVTCTPLPWSHVHLTPGHMYTSPLVTCTPHLVTCTPHPWLHVHLTCT